MYKCTCDDCGRDFTTFDPSWWCDDCRKKRFEKDKKKKPQTNADRIRAMSDEELADAWMKDVVVCHRCAYVEECECDEYVTIEKCKEGLLEWLKQPAEGE